MVSRRARVTAGFTDLNIAAFSKRKWGRTGISSPGWPRSPPKTLPRILELDKFPGAFSRAQAARLLGISRVTLWKLLKVHDIQVDKIIRS